MTTPPPLLLWRRPALFALAALVATLVASCGGGSGPSPGDSLNDPSCTYQYTLPGAVLPLTGADPMLSALWHLRNTGLGGGITGEDVRALDTWPLTRGAGTRIALLDDAVELFHEDLAPNVVSGASFDYRPARYGGIYPLPCTIDDDHGTQVAGVAAARDDNALGIAGVAPRAKFVVFNVLAATTNANIANALTRDGQVNAIYNASWSSVDDGALHRVDASFASAIELGTATGRGGKGSVYVFAAGNGGCFATDSGGVCQDDNPNLDGFLTPRGVNVIGAIDDQGRSPWWAEASAIVLVSAPSSRDQPQPSDHITTTAVGNGYTSDFGGTSSSTPMVSGVVAMMLATNPNLSWRDVRIILARSARKNDAANPDWTTNFGLNRHPRYGFGVVNAQAAVALATGWSSVGTSATLLSCQPLGGAGRTMNIGLPDATPAGVLSPQTDAVTIAPAACPITKIEFVEIEFEASHTYGGDLRVELISPNSLVSTLANERICDGAGDACGAYSPAWTFGSVRHLDEPVPGTWTLRVTDAQDTDIGRWVRWNIRFWGR